MTIYQVGDVLYGIILCSLLHWSNSVPLLAWFVPDIEGWQGAVVHWMFMMRRLVYLLPNGKDIEVSIISLLEPTWVTLLNYKGTSRRL